MKDREKVEEKNDYDEGGSRQRFSNPIRLVATTARCGLEKYGGQTIRLVYTSDEHGGTTFGPRILAPAHHPHACFHRHRHSACWSVLENVNNIQLQVDSQCCQQLELLTFRLAHGSSKPSDNIHRCLIFFGANKAVYFCFNCHSGYVTAEFHNSLSQQLNVQQLHVHGWAPYYGNHLCTPKKPLTYGNIKIISRQYSATKIKRYQNVPC